MLLAVRNGSSTRSVVMMFWYPLPDTSRSSGFLVVPTASSVLGCGAPPSQDAFRHEVCGLSSYPWEVRHLLVPSAGVASVASTCSSPPVSASGCWGSGGGDSGTVVSSSGAGGSGARVAEIGFGLNPRADIDLIKQNQFYH
jgi:hypothetical protein